MRPKRSTAACTAASASARLVTSSRTARRSLDSPKALTTCAVFRPEATTAWPAAIAALAKWTPIQPRRSLRQEPRCAPACRPSPSPLRRRAHDAAEAEMAGRRVDRFRVARGRPIAAAVVGRTEVRAPLDHLAWNPDLRLAGIVAVALLGSTRIVRRAARLHGLVRMPRHVPIGRPLPDVADDVVEPIAVRGKRANRRRPFIPVAGEVLPGKLALPGIGHIPVAGQERVAPRVRCSLQPAPCRELPLRLGGQRFALPRGEGFGVAECDVHDRVLLEPVDGAGVTSG